MTNRAPDWLAQAGHDLEHARHALDDGDFDWSCFAAHQAAEKAVKALFLSLGGEGWGHSITRLLRDASHKLEVTEDLITAAQRLDKHYIPTRYPNGFDLGAPIPATPPRFVIPQNHPSKACATGYYPRGVIEQESGAELRDVGVSPRHRKWPAVCQD